MLALLVDHGYLMSFDNKGVFEEILKRNENVYIPYFCLEELEALSKHFELASEFLGVYYRNIERITVVDNKEWLIKTPCYQATKRVVGVVAAAIDMWITGLDVKILTDSYEIAKLAKMQNCDFDVVIHKR